MSKDLYSILEVNPRARIEVIEAAYKTLMREFHPDTGASHNGRRARELNEAHDILSDSLKRKDYDDSRVPLMLSENPMDDLFRPVQPLTATCMC